MNSFFLVKVTKSEYAEKLMNGEVFMQSLGHFRRIESKTKDEKLEIQIDFTEGVQGYIGSFDEIRDNLDKAIVDDHDEFCAALKRLGVENPKPFYLLDNPDEDEKVFCMYTFYFDTINKTYLLPTDRLRDFGDTVVIIYNPLEFLQRMYNAISEIGVFSQEKIRYRKIFIDGNDFWGKGYKSSKFTWQQEYRIMCKEYQPSEKPLILNIGDISDIAKKINIDVFLDSNNFSFIEGYEPIQKEFSSAEQDIPILLAQEQILTEKLFKSEHPEAQKYYRNAVEEICNSNIETAKERIQSYVLMTQEEPYATNCKPIEQELHINHLRLAEDYCDISSPVKTMYHMNKFLCFFQRAKLFDVKISQFDNEKMHEKISKMCKSIPKDMLTLLWEDPNNTEIRLALLAFFEYHSFKTFFNKDKQNAST